MRNAAILGLFAVAVMISGCKSLHPDPPYFDTFLRQRLAPTFTPMAPVKQKGQSPFTAQRQATNQAVEDILKIEPTYKFSKEKPIKLAICEAGKEGVETIRNEDKKAWRDALEGTGLVKVLFITSNIASANPGFYDLRMAAARLNADAMLVYAAASATEKGCNVGGLLYLTIVGAFFVPGSHAAALTFAKGACWDVRNEYLEFAVEGEDERQTVRPCYFLDMKDFTAGSKKAAVDILRKETVLALQERAKQ
ncbi:MAG: hypothetical protein E3J72_13295 [Planctomycetota bacterium]|nr:MAG: hypothetical protein E3J72_13295 [Planctomycetota bacterium]